MSFSEEIDRARKSAKKKKTADEVFLEYVTRQYNDLKYLIIRSAANEQGSTISGDYRLSTSLGYVTYEEMQLLEEKESDYYIVVTGSEPYIKWKPICTLKIKPQLFSSKHTMIKVSLTDVGKRLIRTMAELAKRDGIELSFQPFLRYQTQVLSCFDQFEKVIPHIYTDHEPMINVHYTYNI